MFVLGILLDSNKIGNVFVHRMNHLEGSDINTDEINICPVIISFGFIRDGQE